MKSKRIFGIQIDWHLQFWRVKRLTFDLPAWADDVCVTTTDANDNEMLPKIKYYHCSTRYYIDLPKCKKAEAVSITPNYDIQTNTVITNRKIVVDIFI